jgi:hypothetical protein
MCVGLAVVVSGCGGSDEEAKPHNDVGALAAEITAQLSSRKSAQVSFELGGMTGQGGYRTAPDLAADFSMTDASGSSRFIVLDKAIYLQLPDKGRAELGVDKPWVRFASGRQGVSALAELMTQQADVGRQIAKMKSAGTIKSATSEDLDGRRTTHYSIDVDVNRLAESEQDPVLKASLQEIREMGTTTIPYQLWLDESNLPVRTIMDVPGDPSGKVTMRYARWGDPVDVAAPPADQVADAPER